jgi:hypothetical protein
MIMKDKQIMILKEEEIVAYSKYPEIRFDKP